MNKVKHTTPLSSWMHLVASSTVAILMKPNPRDLSDCLERLDDMRQQSKAGPTR